MIIRLSTVNDDAQVIPHPFEEGSGVLDRASGLRAHHPLPDPPPRREVMFVEGRRFESGPQKAEESVKMQKKMLK